MSREPELGHPRLVCRCMGVSSPRLIEACRRQKLRSLEDVQRAVRAGGGCGTCHPEIREILQELSGQPMPRAHRLANRETCQRDSERRVEACLAVHVLPRLAPGVSLELVQLRGLELEMQLEGGDAGLEAWIAERLRKLVCNDLQVLFR
ncbi:MAG: (2Fe-2S)-binding protein [Myxococcota bacterium]